MPLRNVRRVSRASKAAAYRRGVRAASVRGRRLARRSLRSKFPTSVSMGVGFPKMIKMTHKYAENITLTSTTGVTQAFRWKANGMYDPNHTGTGHQPMFFDQLGAIYNHFTVIASKIRVQFIPTTSTSVPCHVGINVNDDITGIQGVAVDTIAEQTLTRNKKIAYSPERPATVVSKFSAKKTFGGSVLGNQNLAGATTYDPTELAFYNIYLCAADGSTTVSCYVIVEIEYIAVWRELKDQNSS